MLRTFSSRIIDVLGRNDSALNVHIKQNFVVFCEAGESLDNHVASMYFATYTDPKSGEEVCSFQRNANACFSKYSM